MGMIRGILAALVFVVALHGQAAAQDNDTRVQLARELLTVMEVDKTVAGLFDVMSPVMAQGAAQRLNLSNAESARLGEILAEEFRNGMPEVMSQVADSYAQRLSEQELRDILAFMRSPAGEALRRSQDQMQTDLERIGQVFGMRAALNAMTRLDAERSQAR